MSRSAARPYPTIGAVEVLERIREHPLWAERNSLPEGEGVGMAAGHWPGGNEPAAAVCRVDVDGTMTVVTSAADMSGVNTGFAVIAAATFGLSPDKVRIVTADTSSGPYAGASGGSKVTYTVGAAVLRAAESAREKVLAAAAQELEIAPDDLEVVDGVVRAVGAPDRSITVEELARKALRFGGRYEPIEGHGGSAQTRGAPSVAAHLSHVRVDRETGEVELLRHVIAQDVGRALNPALVEGQMRGGATQGMGWALFEELGHDEDGTPAARARSSTMRSPMRSASRRSRHSSSRCQPRTARSARRASARRLWWVLQPPSQTPWQLPLASRFHELPMTPQRVWSALRT